jgi:hypothetical protein
MEGIDSTTMLLCHCCLIKLSNPSNFIDEQYYKQKLCICSARRCGANLQRASVNNSLGPHWQCFKTQILLCMLDLAPLTSNSLL